MYYSLYISKSCCLTFLLSQYVLHCVADIPSYITTIYKGDNIKAVLKSKKKKSILGYREQNKNVNK